VTTGEELVPSKGGVAEPAEDPDGEGSESTGDPADAKVEGESA